MPKGPTGQPRGRPPGTINKRSAEMVEAAASSGLLPHEILLSFARGEPQIQKMANPMTGEVTEIVIYPDVNMRASCANMAAPYFAPKLAQVQHRGTVGRTADSLSDDDLVNLALGEAGDKSSE